MLDFKHKLFSEKVIKLEISIYRNFLLVVNLFGTHWHTHFGFFLKDRAKFDNFETGSDFC